MEETLNKLQIEPCTIHDVVCCAVCKEQELIEESQREQYLHDLRWHENMNHLYTWDEGGFCDGFTNW
jgi:hypothetical protein